MRSDQHRVRVVVGARTPTEDVSDAVDPNVQPQRFEILDETVPDGLVSTCQREPVESVVFGGTDRRVLLERLPKPIGVYREHVRVFRYSRCDSVSSSTAVAVWTANVSSNSSIAMYSFCDPMLCGVGP